MTPCIGIRFIWIRMLKWFESVESGLHPVHPALPVELLIGAMRILEPSLPPVLIMRPFQERNLISLEAADHLRGKNSAPQLLSKLLGRPIGHLKKVTSKERITIW